MGLWHCQGGRQIFFSGAGGGGFGSTVLPGGSGAVGFAWLFRRLLAPAARLLYNKGSVCAEGAVSAGFGANAPRPAQPLRAGRFPCPHRGGARRSPWPGLLSAWPTHNSGRFCAGALAVPRTTTGQPLLECTKIAKKKRHNDEYQWFCLPNCA